MLAGAALLPAAFIGTAHAQSGTEFTFDRIQRTKVLRIAALPGELPYFKKDITTGEWTGASIDMALSIAKVFDAKLEYVESTYGNSVLDLQSNKIDLAFALNPTPQRALSIGFTHPVMVHPFGCIAKPGFSPVTWSDLDKPEVRIAVDLGSLHETAARRFAPKAEITALKTRDDCVLALQSGRVDAVVQAAMVGLTAVGKNPALAPYHLLSDPVVALPSNLGIRRETDTRFPDVLNAWIDFNRGIGQIREWLIGGMELAGVKRESVPSQLSF
jgi:polar amino acid transport system substrate-binding protein